MTNIFEHLADLRRRAKRLQMIAIPLWFLWPATFLIGSSYCKGGDVISAHRQGDHYTDNVKGTNVYFSVSDFEKAVPLQAISAVCGLGFAGLGAYSELLKRRIRQAENWLAYNRVEIPTDATRR